MCDLVDFLQVVISILLDIHWSYKNMLFWAGIVRYSVSANQIFGCFKLKKLKKDMRYQVDFLLPLKLEQILCYFGLWPQNTLDQSVCRMFYFWLLDLLNIKPGVHCHIVLVKTCFGFVTLRNNFDVHAQKCCREKTLWQNQKKQNHA